MALALPDGAHFKNAGGARQEHGGGVARAEWGEGLDEVKVGLVKDRELDFAIYVYGGGEVGVG